MLFAQVCKCVGLLEIRQQEQREGELRCSAVAAVGWQYNHHILRLHLELHALIKPRIQQHPGHNSSTCVKFYHGQ